MPATKRIITYLNVFLFFCLLLSCKKNEELTGSLKIFLRGNPQAIVPYQLYTEGAWSAPSAAFALKTGNILSGTIIINDLNPGNYILMVGGSYWSVQVTAGREREYTL
jgi:hypothetical protein